MEGELFTTGLYSQSKIGKLQGKQAEHLLALYKDRFNDVLASSIPMNNILSE